MVVNYERPPFSPQPKSSTPRVLDKRDDKREAEKAERETKDAIRARDPFCRVCLYRASAEVHELVPKSLGGEVSFFNSLGVCAARNGGLCHQLLQQHGIRYVFLQPGRGADGRMQFEMNASVAKAVFGRRPIPSHIVILEGAAK